MLKEYALHYYGQGYNCAESLVYGANTAWNLNLDENACHLMAGLGGGLQVGDVCGALSGAVCALSCLIVKTKAHDCAELKPCLLYTSDSPPDTTRPPLPAIHEADCGTAGLNPDRLQPHCASPAV